MGVMVVKSIHSAFIYSFLFVRRNTDTCVVFVSQSVVGILACGYFQLWMDYVIVTYEQSRKHHILSVLGAPVYFLVFIIWASNSPQSNQSIDSQIKSFPLCGATKMAKDKWQMILASSNQYTMKIDFWLNSSLDFIKNTLNKKQETRDTNLNKNHQKPRQCHWD